ncbi:hypothetical protein VP01_1042g2 [Puccinia sorghi]|uniref:Uncharacterized protein n=1 Tax=Puccinia sorghi TaxID=27349 RepID=A0A0L6VUK2_9BASI|nr:hypothetical protein VP01_1042g2 [Puccinia sorghi]
MIYWSTVDSLSGSNGRCVPRGGGQFRGNFQRPLATPLNYSIGLFLCATFLSSVSVLSSPRSSIFLPGSVLFFFSPVLFLFCSCMKTMLISFDGTRKQEKQNYTKHEAIFKLVLRPVVSFYSVHPRSGIVHIYISQLKNVTSLLNWSEPSCNSSANLLITIQQVNNLGDKMSLKLWSLQFCLFSSIILFIPCMLCSRISPCDEIFVPFFKFPVISSNTNPFHPYYSKKPLDPNSNPHPKLRVRIVASHTFQPNIYLNAQHSTNESLTFLKPNATTHFKLGNPSINSASTTITPSPSVLSNHNNPSSSTVRPQTLSSGSSIILLACLKYTSLALIFSLSCASTPFACSLSLRLYPFFEYISSCSFYVLSFFPSHFDQPNPPLSTLGWPHDISLPCLEV